MEMTRDSVEYHAHDPAVDDGTPVAKPVVVDARTER